MKPSGLYSLIGSLFICVITIDHACKEEESAKPPVVTTATVSSITTSTATSGGNITSDGGAEILANGVCWSTNSDPSTTDSKTEDTVGTAQFVSNMSGLITGTNYHVRAYAVNSAGTAYGDDIAFSTLGEAPESLTLPATNMSIYGATLNGTINANYLSSTVTFEYGLTTGYGQTATAIQNPVTGNSMTNVSTDITGLIPGTVYHFRVKTENQLGTTYGADLFFTTLSNLPGLTTISVSDITSTTSKSGGNITSDGGTPIIARGVCWSTSPDPTIADNKTNSAGGLGVFLSNINDLTPNSTYYLRAFATNDAGTAYGNEVIFRTYAVMDLDGNGYYSVTIGTQVWMSENLKTTRYNEGSPIPDVTDITEWHNLTTGAYCWYDNNSATNKNIYGALYNWYTVNTGKLCPSGWHIPSNDEWTILKTFLGGSSAGGKMKETGTAHWQSPNTGATNESGFTGLPGGHRDFSNDQIFSFLGQRGFWWSSTQVQSTAIYCVSLGYSFTFLDMSLVERVEVSGFSVRCLKDN